MTLKSLLAGSSSGTKDKYQSRRSGKNFPGTVGFLQKKKKEYLSVYCRCHHMENLVSAGSPVVTVLKKMSTVLSFTNTDTLP